MKTLKKIFAMAFVAVVGLAGCQQELVDPNAIEGDALKVYATIEDAEDTKTYLNDREVYWTSGDRIAVFMNKTLRKRFEVSSESVGTKEGTFLYDSDYIVTGKSVAISNNVAYYPFCEVTCAVSGSTYTLSNVTIPTTQDYAPASFGQGTFPMVAVTADTDDLDFAFKNLCGVLAFQLKGSGTVRSITVEGNSDEILSGKATVTASFGKNPEISLLPDGSKTVTLDCGETGVFLQNDTPTSFFIVLPPVSFDNGFTVTVTDAAGTTAEYSTTKKNIVHRSGILRMPEKEYVGANTSVDHDYVDEYGINHGPGVEIDGVIWAPVNCGYHETDYPYGKLYQWGRKYGQGYSGGLFDGSWNYYLGDVSDATVPEIREGGVSLSGGQSETNANVFFLGDSENIYDWLYQSDDTLWNSGTESYPVKTEYDPCPDGWRVPTCAELDELSKNKSSCTTNDKQQTGYWLSGQSSYTSSVPQVFFPAAGYRSCIDGTANCRGFDGSYWSLSPYDDGSAFYLSLFFYDGSTYMSYSSRANGYSVRCVYDENAVGMEWPVPDDNVEIPVSTVIISTSSLKLYEGNVAQLTTKLRPIDAIDTAVTWNSDTPSVATVDQTGFVTAVSAGEAIITAVAGGKSGTCSITVASLAAANADYVDEYGKNHGKGIAVGMTVWAPVNCGYHETDYPYGKLYQWGRKYGQGYDSDATVPEIREGGVSLAGGQSEENANVFFLGDSENNYDWVYPSDRTLWNSGTEEEPVKTEYDPCPDGWRVPTYSELDELSKNKSSLTTNDKQQTGYWLSGQSSYTSSVPQVFFPGAGEREYDGSAYYGGSHGFYWSSLRPYDYGNAFYLYLDSGFSYISYIYCGCGCSVRCVQVTD